MASENSTTSRVRSNATKNRADLGGGAQGVDVEENKVGETESSGGSGSTSNTEDLGDKFKYLNLHEDEQGDVVLEEDLEELDKDAEFMALARIHTSRTFSHGAFTSGKKGASPGSRGPLVPVLEPGQNGRD